MSDNEILYSPTFQKLPSSPLKEINWMIEVKQILEAPTEEGLDKPPYIFNVPKALKSIKPEGYAPQLLSLGPYHCFRDDLYEMERFKALTVRKVLKEQFSNCSIDEIVRMLHKHDAKIRSRYEKHLKMCSEELLLIMAIDGIFLLEFFRACTTSDENSRNVINVSPRLSFMVDSKQGHTKPSYDLLIKDAMMLENQVPIYALKWILEIQYSNLDHGREILAQLFFDMCKKICPFSIKAEQHTLDAHSALKSKGHFLGFMYSFINPSWNNSNEEIQHSRSHSFETNGVSGANGGCTWRLPFSNTRHQSPKKVFKDLLEVVSQLPIFKQGPLKVVGALKDAATKITNHLKTDRPPEDSNNEGDTFIQVEEIEIPSVAVLVKHGVEFKPVKGGLDKIKYDIKTQTFELPVIRLDLNSEVIIRNLVAYEAMAIQGPQILARYTELMNGIVDTEDDARILKDKKIIEGDLKNQEIANLWNGMSKCIRVTRVDVIDEAIKNVNKEFNSLRTVKIYRMCKAYIHGSWKMIMFLATLLVICLMLLQSFCTVYNCPRLFHLEAAMPKK